MRVVVTGAAGFIGSHLCEALLEAGHEVRALVRYTSDGRIGNLAFLPEEVRDRLEIRRGDIRDPFFTRELVADCQGVLHLAALIAIPYSYVAPQSFVETNVLGTINMLEAARMAGVQRFVQTSTSEVYGTAQRVPIDEGHPLHPQSPYAASKVASDQLALSYQRTWELPVVVLRPFNTYGPRQSERAVLPTILSQGLALGYVTLGSLKPRRDWTYVTDTTDGFVRALETEGIEGEVIQLGTGVDVTVGEAANQAFEILGKEPDIRFDEARVRPDNSEVMRLLADPSRAQDRLGWTARVSFAEGLKRTADWLRGHLESTSPGRYVV
ncbi:MAG: GDP-mannose 4,6-dehydratase [Deltaproteobacteria bacterium]|jgi:NAD dependent epimerase/dehydratase|nr:GDP-mannose 4,6-dehydratase [Deltaproteobacteria bacterium]MBW2532017.1 GDP-mannose 4,6-dehydratase [Deltaproteobacteria bacterium]